MNQSEFVKLMSYILKNHESNPNFLVSKKLLIEGENTLLKHLKDFNNSELVDIIAAYSRSNVFNDLPNLLPKL